MSSGRGIWEQDVQHLNPHPHLPLRVTNLPQVTSLSGSCLHLPTPLGPSLPAHNIMFTPGEGYPG